jgi:flagellar hook-associated protein 3 FlgL
MRISSNNVSDAIVRQIQQLSSQQAKLQNQVSTGLRISQPEDDPAAVGRVLNLESESRQLAQFGANASRALEVAQVSASGLQGLKKISDRAGELATLGTGVLGPDGMKTYAAEADQLIEEALQFANTRSNGDYVYAGSKIDAPPFNATRDVNGKVAAVSYDGDAAQTTIPLSEGSSISPTTDGATNTNFKSFIDGLIALRDALNSGTVANVSAAQPALASSGDALVSAIADNGGVQTRIEAAQSQQADRAISLTGLISHETDADLPTTIVKLNQTQTAYQAALASAAKIMNQSLLDYIK